MFPEKGTVVLPRAVDACCAAGLKVEMITTEFQGLRTPHAEKLLRAAAKAPRPEAAELSFATQTRTLAAWRASRAATADFGPLYAWRTGLATAFGMAVLAVGLSFAASRNIDTDVNDPYVVSDPGFAVAMSTGWLP